MIAIVLDALFVLGGITAVFAIWATLRRYGRAALALRGELRACRDMRDLHFSVREANVRERTRVFWPDFTNRRMEPGPQAWLLAAA